MGDFQPNPVTCQTSDGNYVFAWIVMGSSQEIALQKISLAGQKMWGQDPIIYSSGTSENYTYPAVVPSDNGSVIVVYSGFTGTFMAPYFTYAQKFDTDGIPLWSAEGVVIEDVGAPFYEHPYVMSDDNDGAFVAWYDDRDFNNLFSSFVQHVTLSGSLSFPVNGAEVSTNGSMHHIYPALAYNPGADELYCFWLEETTNQDNFAVYGQKFDALGNKLWNNNGISFTSMTQNAMFAPHALTAGNSVYVLYLQGNQSGVNTGVYALMVDADGNLVWNPEIVTMSNPTANKLHSVSTIASDNIAKIAWEDTRNDGGGIYAQNINLNGELGNIPVPVELISFTGALNGNTITLNWSTATELNNRGFDVQRTLGPDGWQSIGFVDGNGTSTNRHTYSFTDKNLTAGSYSYRLKQMDNDGSSKFITLSESFTVEPGAYDLSQNYPNPFNPSTIIKYSVPEKTQVVLKIYNMLGSQITSLVNEVKPAGNYEVHFDASGLSSGVYYYTITAGKFTSTKKMILMK